MPSVGPGSIAVEAYLRLTGKPFSVETCPSERSSPTGQLPCLEMGDALVGPPAPAVVDEVDASAPPDASWGHGAVLGAAGPSWTEMDAAAVCIRYLRRKVYDLDASLGPGAQAQCTAFISMVTAKVFPAVMHAMWVDADAFRAHTSKEYFSGLPFPSSWTQPKATRAQVLQLFQHVPEVRGRPAEDPPPAPGRERARP